MGKNTVRAKTAGVWVSRIAPFFGLVCVVVFFTIVTKGRLLSSNNLGVLVNSCFTIMLASVGGVFVYAHGGIDLSIGALQGLCLSLSSLLIARSMNNVWLALVMCAALGIVSGLATGMLRAVLNVPAFIASIAMMYILRGIVNTLSLNNQLVFPANYAKMDSTVARLVVLVVVIVVGYILFEFTAIGRVQKAIGSNPVSVDATGINSKFYITLAHVFLGFCVGLGAFFVSPRVSIVLATAGSGLEMDVLIAILIGGMGISGGSGAHLRSGIVGSATIAILNNGFALWGIQANIIQLVKALVFLTVVVVTQKDSFAGFGKLKTVFARPNN